MTCHDYQNEIEKSRMRYRARLLYWIDIYGGLYVCDADGCVESARDDWEREYGCEPSELLTRRNRVPVDEGTVADPAVCHYCEEKWVLPAPVDFQVEAFDMLYRIASENHEYDRDEIVEVLRLAEPGVVVTPRKPVEILQANLEAAE